MGVSGRLTTFSNATIVARRTRLPPGLFSLASWFGAAVFAFAGAYYLSTAFALGRLGNADGALDFGTCVYFSVITITTLGYGDVAPHGLARAIACVEVVLGLGFVGVLVDRLVSWRATYQLNALLQGRLDDEIQRYRDELKKLIKDGQSLGHAVSQRTANSVQIERLLGPTTDATAGVFDEISTVIRAYARRLRHAVQEFPYYENVPIRPVARLMGEIRDCLRLAQGFALPNLSQDSCPPGVDCKRLRKRIWQMAESAFAIADSLKRDTSIPDFHHLADVIAQQVAALKSDTRVNQHGRDG